MSTKPAKRLEFAASVDRAGRLAAEGCPPIEVPKEWTPESLLLAGLGRCTLASLRYHARNAGLDMVGSASVAGVVTRRESDGRYAFVEVACELDVELEPDPEDLPGLLAKAERDCFISASLNVKTRYSWRVNGREAAAAG